MSILQKEYERSTEDFIVHFKRTYTEPFPPAWILGELLPMGSVNMYYRNLKDKTLKKQIAKRFICMLRFSNHGCLYLRLPVMHAATMHVYGIKQ